MTKQEIEKIFMKHSQSEIVSKYSEKELIEMFSLYIGVRPNPAFNKGQLAQELKNAVHFDNRTKIVFNEEIHMVFDEDIPII